MKEALRFAGYVTFLTILMAFSMLETIWRHKVVLVIVIGTIAVFMLSGCVTVTFEPSYRDHMDIEKFRGH